MHMMRELLGMQLVEIGAAFGGRDHSTVIHSLERVAAMMKEDPSFAQRLAKLQSALESLRN
jgi:chromosomal replication initiator protein